MYTSSEDRRGYPDSRVFTCCMVVVYKLWGLLAFDASRPYMVPEEAPRYCDGTTNAMVTT